MPSIPTLPLEKSWAASHSMASYESCVSSAMYSSVDTPAELPVPREFT